MLIDLAELIPKYNMDITGILHIGAHMAEEAPKYDECHIHNVYWVDANTDLEPQLRRALAEYPDHKLFWALISDKDEEYIDFNITNNLMSSSILQLGLHEKYSPDVWYVERRELRTITIDQLVYLANITGVNMLNLDIQGAELLALKGAKKMLNDIRYIYSEVNTGYVYKDCALLPEMDEYLGSFGFSRVETVMTPAEWGDGLYVR